MRPLAFLLAAAAALSACGPTVQYQRAPDTRIAAGSRWAWSPPDRDGLAVADGAIAVPDSLASTFRGAIERALAAKGFARTVPESAQFLIHYHVARRAVADTLPPRDDPPPGVRAPGTWGGYGRPEEIAERTVSWTEGVLIIDALRPDDGVVAWRGIIAGEVPARAESHAAPAIDEAVRRLLKGFP